LTTSPWAIPHPRSPRAASMTMDFIYISHR
jgi:hypothetical protein